MISYLQEENKVLREQLSGKQIQFTDSQRRRLARRGKLENLIEHVRIKTVTLLF